MLASANAPGETSSLRRIPSALKGLLLTVWVLLSSCATPQTVGPAVQSGAVAEEQHRQSVFVLERRASEYARLYSIAERVTEANTEFCRRTAPAIGIRVENVHDYPREFRDAARSVWGLSEVPTVQWVAADGPAEQAGVRPRDQILAVNGRTITGGRRASGQVLRAIREAARRGNVELQIRRGAVESNVAIAPTVQCAYQFIMVDNGAVNAAADGSNIIVNRGMLRFVESDDELALVIAHELAHNAMGHIEAMQQNAAAGALAGLLVDVLAASAGVNTGGAFSDAGGDIGRMMFSQDFESEADYVGMYFLARAGYRADDVETFWRRMAAENPGSIRLAYTHPNTAERFLRLAAARSEIAGKVARGEALRPNLRGENAAAPTSGAAQAVAPVASGEATQSPPITEGASSEVQLAASPGGPDLCEPARADWDAIQGTRTVAILLAFRESLPAACTAQRAQVDARLSELSTDATAVPIVANDVEEYPPSEANSTAGAVTPNAVVSTQAALPNGTYAYRCSDGRVLRVVFDRDARAARVQTFGRGTVRLDARADDGSDEFAFVGASSELRGRVSEVRWQRAGGRVLTCPRTSW